MEKKDREKYGNFVHEQRKKEEEILEICQEVLKSSKNELGVSMPFLYGPLSSLRPVLSEETASMGTDGEQLFVSPGWLIPIFMNHKYPAESTVSSPAASLSFLPYMGKKEKRCEALGSGFGYCSGAYCG